MANLFSSFELKGVKLRNRIAVPPMCQYSATDGLPNEWHWGHYGALGRGGAGLVIVEATGVAPEGRITPACLGLWNDEQMELHKEIVKSITRYGAVAGIQIGHAGIKASANLPWEGDDHIPLSDPRAWETLGPSAVSFGTPGLSRVAKEMNLEDIERVKNNFVSAAKRALSAGYQWLELHFAHGYLAQSFFSRHTNLRTDSYGGNPENRGRFLLETIQAVRQVWPSHLPLTARFGVLEFDGQDEETLQEAIALTKKFKEFGLDFMNVSMGFTTPHAHIPWSVPAFMAPIAERVRKEVGIPVASAWGIDTPKLANDCVEQGQLDLVMVGKAHLANPHWTYKAAVELKKDKASWVLPAPYAHWLERYGLK